MAAAIDPTGGRRKALDAFLGTKLQEGFEIEAHTDTHAIIVERMAAFVKSHGRIEFLVYFSSRPGSLWDLASKPRSRAAYRRHITPLGR